MNSDLISREQALLALKEIEPTVWTESEYELGQKNQWSADEFAIETVPSAEPKKGRWIFARHFVWECSECGKSPTRGMGYTQSRNELFRYCPNCGAKMEVKE